jgi:peptidoglycan/LPS O-acetylase OafA/YrhL
MDDRAARTRWLLAGLASSEWAGVLHALSGSNGFGAWPMAIIQPFIVLAGLTLVIGYGMRSRPNAFLIAAAVSPVLATTALVAAVLVSGS